MRHVVLGLVQGQNLDSTRIFYGWFLFLEQSRHSLYLLAYRTTEGSSEGGVGWFGIGEKTPVPMNSKAVPLSYYSAFKRGGFVGIAVRNREFNCVPGNRQSPLLKAEFPVSSVNLISTFARTRRGC